MKQTTFNIKVTVPSKEWKWVQKLDFKEEDLPSMVAGMIRDLAEQAEDITTNPELAYRR